MQMQSSLEFQTDRQDCDAEAHQATRTGQFVEWHHQVILADRSQMSPRSYIGN